MSNTVGSNERSERAQGPGPFGSAGFAGPPRPGVRERANQTWSRVLAARDPSRPEGAGEIMLNAMDADGTQDGFDLELIRAVRTEVSIPVIASGGAGTVDHFPPAVEVGADAVLAATIFHFGKVRIGEVKESLGAAGYPVR